MPSRHDSQKLTLSFSAASKTRWVKSHAYPGDGKLALLAVHSAAASSTAPVVNTLKT
jgi:hypothetical protein